jgi:ubiquinone/menaquinone biosynthesis C-methylase UbiE
VDTGKSRAHLRARARPEKVKTPSEVVMEESASARPNGSLAAGEMLDHYQQFDEANRLSSGMGELERDRTRDILLRHLPQPPATVLDIGGAAGVHALWLAQQGFEVHLFDLVPHHVEQARLASERQSVCAIASCTVADARRIDRPDASSDAILLLGPLYHLTERPDRIGALREAYRLLRPGGRVFAATISRFASLIDGLARDLISDPIFVEILRSDLKTGQHLNPTGNPDYFMTTFFHSADDLRQELTEAGFQVEKLIGVEGPTAFMSHFDKSWKDPAKRSLLLDLLRTVEQEPSILGVSAHPMGIGKK